MRMVILYHVCSIILQDFVYKNSRILLFVIIIIITVTYSVIPLLDVKNIHLTGRANLFKNSKLV